MNPVTTAIRALFTRPGLQSPHEPTPEAVRTLQRIPLVAQIIGEEDAKAQARRREIRAQLDAWPPAADARRLAELTSGTEAAARKVAELTEQLRQARLRHNDLSTQASGWQGRLESQKSALQRALIESADERLLALIHFVDSKADAVRHAFWVQPRRDEETGRIVYDSNHETLVAVQKVLGDVKTEAQRLQLQPMLRDEVTAALAPLLDRLAAALERVEIVTPTLDPETGDIVYQPHVSQSDEIDAILHAAGAPGYELARTHRREREAIDAAVASASSRGRRVIEPGRVIHNEHEG